MEHLCTKPQTTSKSPFSRVTKHFKKKSKLLVGTSASASADEVDEDAKSKDETELTTPPSTLKGTGEQAAPLLNNSQPTVKGWKETTICLQNGLPVGTISFESESLKNEALARHAKDKKSCWKGWIVEDNFKGVAILYEGPDAKFDICAVHGLGGNAIDTWTADRGKMWLRDLLPEHQNFENSRIMTFGYDSDFTDKSNVMVLENWAETLVVSLNQVRTEDKEQKRPLLFVSHSLGGFVVRQAMARLHLTPNCKNITLPQCAIVFLATPHSGSTKADWSNFLVATANLIGGVRQETVKILQSFNTASVWDTAAFLGLDPCPPFRCYAEGAMMDVKGTHQLIVTQGSATLGNNQAHMIMGADHSSICKFNSRHGIFVTITMALWELFNEVTTGGVQQPKTQQDRRMFGQPRAYPPDRGFWWEGTELNEIQHQLTSTTPFFGRSEELKRLESLASKIELLLQFAAKQRGLRNIFFLTSQDEESIDCALSKISTRIGFDMIQDPVTNQDRWRSTPVSERIQIFITWLGDICNKDSLFIIDDVEGFGYSEIPMIIKYPAHHVIVSTRDSNSKGANRDFQEVRLPPLGHHDTVKVLQSTLENLSAEPAYWKGLDSVSHRIQGYPLAARNAIVFMMEYLATYDMPSSAFTDLFESPDPEDRKTFLQFSFEGRSLWDAFHASLERLELRPNHQSATSFLRILPFLSTNNGYVHDFLKMDKRWLSDCGNELPDIVILKSGYMTISAWLHKLREQSKAKCPIPDATAAFQKITRSNTRSNNESVPGDSSNPGDIVHHKKQEPFPDHRDRTRTMVISSRVNEGATSAYIWRSYGSGASNSASIWEVARATCAHPVYFGPIEIHGVTHFDGGLVANNPSSKILQEVYLQHNKAPLVFVTIGTGAETKEAPKIAAKWQESSALRKLSKYAQIIKAVRNSGETELVTETVTKRWLEASLERAYRLDPEGDLQKIPFDDWRPATTGRTTL
ncbi:hypothetical protein FBULB1_4151 [Fusarium bulbicola]|nr:hypothetical protein FBULB1_4151 [Fusarium bulbicola]